MIFFHLCPSESAVPELFRWPEMLDLVHRHLQSEQKAIATSATAASCVLAVDTFLSWGQSCRSVSQSVSQSVSTTRGELVPGARRCRHNGEDFKGWCVGVMLLPPRRCRRWLCGAGDTTLRVASAASRGQHCCSGAATALPRLRKGCSGKAHSTLRCQCRLRYVAQWHSQIPLSDHPCQPVGADDL